uniref:Ion transport domain-containing protein n=1 Tax=Ditylenchus dipsaci TaxID=166011 RepID=A0A915DK51_9BILA
MVLSAGRAPSHRAYETKRWIADNFPDAITVDPHHTNAIGQWAPNSPDWNVMDYFGWPYLQSKACSKPHKFIPALKASLYSMLNVSTTSYLYCLLLSFWQPVPLLPLNVGYSNGIFRNSSPLLVIQLHKLQQWFGRAKWFVLVYLTCSLIAFIDIWLFFDSIQVDTEVYKKSLYTKVGWHTPSADTAFLLVLIEKEPSLGVLQLPPYNYSFYALMCIFVAVEAVVIVNMNLKIMREISKSKSE